MLYSRAAEETNVLRKIPKGGGYTKVLKAGREHNNNKPVNNRRHLISCVGIGRVELTSGTA